MKIRHENFPKHISPGAGSFTVSEPVDRPEFNQARFTNLVEQRDTPRADYMMRTRELEITTCRLATQDIRVAFDEVAGVLYVGETKGGGWVERVAERAVIEGKGNPFLNEVDEASGRRRVAEAQAERDAQQLESERRVREHQSKMTAVAIENLKSPKSGVRRRAKRLLAKLGAR